MTAPGALSPDLILGILDEAQAALNDFEYDLRGLMWAVISDLLDSLGGYASWDFGDVDSADVVSHCVDMLTDYVTNHYGDD